MARSPSTSGRHWPGLLVLAAVAACAAIVVALLVFVDSENEPPPESLSTVADLTGRFLGASVTIEGTVSETGLPEDAFALSGDSEDDVVVVVPAAGTDPPPLQVGETVQATGVVHGTDESGLIGTPEGIDLDFGGPLSQYRDRAVIVSEGLSLRTAANPEAERETPR